MIVQKNNVFAPRPRQSAQCANYKKENTVFWGPHNYATIWFFHHTTCLNSLAFLLTRIKSLSSVFSWVCLEWDDEMKNLEDFTTRTDRHHAGINRNILIQRIIENKGRFSNFFQDTSPPCCIWKYIKSFNLWRTLRKLVMRWKVHTAAVYIQNFKWSLFLNMSKLPLKKQPKHHKISP